MGVAGATIGEQELLAVAWNWTPERWNLTEANAQLDRLSATQTLAQRIGPSVSLIASGTQAGAFEAHAETPFLAPDVQGALDEDGNLIRNERPAVGISDFVSWCFALAREYGYTTRGASRNGAGIATADLAWQAIFATGKPAKNAKGEPIAPNAGPS